MPLPQTLLVIVGDELLGGFTTDTNGALAARRLFEAGYPVRRIEIVADIVDDIVVVLRRGIDDPSITRVLVAGGIGPTPDDRTHEAVARALGRELVEHPAALLQIETLVARMHAAGWVTSPVPTPANRKMARMAEGVGILENPRGMAPGLAVELGPAPAGAPAPAGRVTRPPSAAVEGGAGAGGPSPWSRWLFVLPGVPREFAAMLEEVLIPSHFAGSEAMAVVETRHPGAIEADFAEPMRRLEQEFPDVAVGSYPQQRGRDLVIRLRGTDPGRVRAAGDRLRELRAEA